MMVFAFVPAELKALLLSDGLLGEAGGASVGVGGVTWVSGASNEALGGVLGAVTIVGMSRMLVVGLFGLDSNDWTLSDAFEGLPHADAAPLVFLEQRTKSVPIRRLRGCAIRTLWRTYVLPLGSHSKDILDFGAW
jgi:hypothetical protein